MINFMLKYGRGLICVPVTEERAQKLGLSTMVQSEPRQPSGQITR